MTRPAVRFRVEESAVFVEIGDLSRGGVSIPLRPGETIGMIDAVRELSIRTAIRGRSKRRKDCSISANKASNTD